MDTKYPNYNANHPNVKKFLMKMNSFLPNWIVHDYQIEYLNMIAKEDDVGRNGLVALPTGMGKTMALFYATLGGRTIYVTPSVALTNEKYAEIPDVFPTYSVLRDTGSDTATRKEHPELFKYEDHDLIVTTNERLLYMINGKDRDRIFDGIDYIVFDEIHKISDVSRGANLEYVLMLVKKEFPKKTIIGLSATLPNYKPFAGWLKAGYYYKPPEERPVPLIPEYAMPVPNRYRKAQEKRDFKFKQLKHYINTMDGQFLVFMNSKMAIQQYSTELYLEFNPNHTGEITLEKMMEFGIATHYRGMDESDQLEVVRRFNMKEDEEIKDGDFVLATKKKINTIFCTTTLAEGVNMSATNCVIFDFSFWVKLAGKHEFNEYDQITQIMGRAGRPNMGIDFGRAIFLGTGDELLTAEDYVNNPRDSNSQFGRVIVDKILNMIAMQYGNTIKEIDEIIKQSFLIYQLKQNNESIESTDLIRDAIELLLKYNLIRLNKNGKYYTTSEGYLTTSNALPVHSVIDFLHQLSKAVTFDNFYDIYRVFISTEDILAPINYDERKDLTSARYTRRFFTTNGNTWLMKQNLLINIYDKDQNKHVLVDHSNELFKFLTMVFSEDLTGKKHFNAGTELDIHQKKASDHIDRMIFIFKKKITDKGMTEDQLKTASMAMQLGTLDEGVIELGQIKGIGKGRIDKLLKIGVNSIEKLCNTPYPKLKRRGVRISEKKLEQIAQEFGFSKKSKLDEWF